MAKPFAALLNLLALLPTLAFAREQQSLTAIDARAARALEGSGFVARPVDRGLRLAPCPEALSAAILGTSAVAIRCDRLGWRVRVPAIAGTATANAARVIDRGDLVTVEFVGSHFTVNASGIAMSDAAVGGAVRVKIGQNARPVTGEAVEAGKVRVRR